MCLPLVILNSEVPKAGTGKSTSACIMKPWIFWSRGWRISAFGTPIMENQMEKNMENEMETVFIWGIIGVIVILSTNP